MMKVTVWTAGVLAVCLLLVGGCAKPKVELSAFSQDQLIANDMKVFWTAELPLREEEGETLRSLYRQKGHLYAITSQNRLLAIDSFSGVVKWTKSLGPGYMITTPVAQLGTQVTFVAILDELKGFVTDTGQPLPTRELKMAPSTALFVTPNFIYYGTHEGWFYGEHLTNLAMNWDRLTHAAILCAPVADADQVYFANAEGTVFASDANQRRILWTFQAGDAFAADLKLSGTQGLILAASRDYSLYAINPTSGRLAWVCTVGDPLLKAPHVVGDRIYIIKEDRVLLAINELAGEQPLWTVEGVDEFLAASPRAVYVLTSDQKITALSPADGSALFAIDADRTDLFAVNDVDGQIFAATRDGKLAAVREIKGKYDDPGKKATEETAEEEVLVE